MKSAVSLLLFAMLLAGCATPAQVYEFKNARDYAVTKDVLWDRLMRYFATSNIQIKTLEKSSGVVYAEKMLADAPPVTWDERGKIGDMADCGKDMLTVPASHIVQFNVYVRDVPGSSRSSATITASFRETYQDMSYTTGPPPPRSCNSTGLLERRILDILEQP